MRLDFLSEFILTARLGSFSAAAEELFISQSSLSKHIIALEKELKVKLLIRTPRKVTLTDTGAKIIPLATQILEVKQQIMIAAAEESNRENPVLNIASIPVMAVYGITDAIAGFNKIFSFIKLSISEFETDKIISLLESGECELAFMRRLKDKSANIDCISFFKDHLIAVIPVSHQLNSEKTIRLNQLEKDDFIFLDKGTAIYDVCIELCANAGFKPKVKFICQRPEDIIAMVSKDMGTALLMKRHVKYYKKSGVKIKNIIPTMESTICLVKMKNHKLSPSAELFWEYMQKGKNNNIQYLKIEKPNNEG